MMTLLAFISIIGVITAIARYNESEKLFWSLLVSFVGAYAAVNVAVNLLNDDKKDDKKAKPTFHYALMKEKNGGKQMKDVWTGPLTPPKEKKEGKHPTQKPLYILERIIEASTNEGDLVLDPFCGSSTTGVAAKRLSRQYIGIDNNPEYLDLSVRRLENLI